MFCLKVRFSIAEDTNIRWLWQPAKKIKMVREAIKQGEITEDEVPFCDLECVRKSMKNLSH